MNASPLAAATLGSMIVASLRVRHNRPAFIDSSGALGYADAEAAVERLHRRFAELDLRRGDTIAQIAGNRTETWLTLAAAFTSGMRSLALNPSGSVFDHSGVLRDAGAKVVVVDDPHRGSVPYLRHNNRDTTVLVHGASGADAPTLWVEPADPTTHRLTDHTEPEDIIRLAYTGGTTGQPKGVMLSSRSLLSNTLLWLTVIDWPQAPTLICSAPISHASGSLVTPALWRGGTVVLQDGFDPDTWLDAVETYDNVISFLVPTMIYRILDHPRTRSADLSGLHTIVYGAAPIAPSRLVEASDVFGPVMHQTYGQTECPNTVLTLSKADHQWSQQGATGRPCPGVEVTLVDASGDSVPAGGVGEICVRGSLLMSGYLNQDDATAEVLEDGWLHTGDLARVDDDGLLHIVGRCKEMIITGGFNVYPRDVEQVIESHPEVKAVAVIGVPHPTWGEAVTAVVELAPNASVGAVDLIDLVKLHKGPVYAPKSVQFVDVLPLTALGKPDRRAITAAYGSSHAVAGQ